MKTFTLSSLTIILACILFYQITGTGCKKQDPDHPGTDSSTINKPPGQFTVSLESISFDTAIINWLQPVDPENDSIHYKVIINDTVKNADYTGLTYTFKNLKELTTYNIKIIAVDSKQHESPEALTITTKKYWLTLLKKVEYGSINGYSSQKCGQMVKANDGNGYIIVGESELSEWPNGPFKMFVIKIDTLGNKLWQQFYDYSVENNFEIKIVSNNTNGYIICGGDNVIKITNTGDLVWRQSSSYQLINQEINGIAVDGDGFIYAVGEIAVDSSVNIFEAILNKYDQNGNLIMGKKYSPSTDDYFSDIKVTTNNQLIVLGGSGTRTPAEARDFWVMNLNKEGDILWSHTYPTGLGYAFPESIIQTKEGNYVFTGFNLGSLAIPYFYLQMIDPNGNNVWSYYSDDNLTKAYSVAETNDNSLIVAGGYQLTYSAQSSLYKFDKSGNKIWEELYPEFATYLFNKTVIPTDDGGYIINCQKSKPYNSEGETDQIYIFKTNDVGEFNN